MLLRSSKMVHMLRNNEAEIDDERHQVLRCSKVEFKNLRDTYFGHIEAEAPIQQSISDQDRFLGIIRKCENKNIQVKTAQFFYQILKLNTDCESSLTELQAVMTIIPSMQCDVFKNCCCCYHFLC